MRCSPVTGGLRPSTSLSLGPFGILLSRANCGSLVRFRFLPLAVFGFPPLVNVESDYFGCPFVKPYGVDDVRLEG